MSTIVTRTGKGSALTWAEADANFTNLNTDKVESSALGNSATLDVGTIAGTVAAGNHNHSGVYEPADATILKAANIGVSVQASDATLTSLSGLSLVQGDILYATAADTLARLPKGTASQELRMNAGATAPEWYTPTVASSAVIKVVEATPVTSVITIATATTLDDSIPQNTEGTEVITVSITPTSTTNRLRIEFNAPTIGTASSGALVAALFQDTTANALAAGYAYPSGASAAPLSLTHEMAAGTTASTTFKIRLSCQSGAAYLNGNLNLGTRAFGGVSAARLRVIELAP